MQTMSNSLYQHVWSPEIERALSDGSAQLMRDRTSGLHLPVAISDSKIIGLPRLIPGVTTAGEWLTPILAGANLFTGVANLIVGGVGLWQQFRISESIKIEGEITRDTVRQEGHATRKTIKKDGNKTRKAVSDESRTTRRAVHIDGSLTRHMMLRGLQNISGQLEDNFDKLDFNISGLKTGIKKLTELTAAGILLTTRLAESQKNGLYNVLSGLSLIRIQTAESFDRLERVVKSEIERIGHREVRKATEQLLRAERRLAMLGVSRSPERELGDVVSGLESDVLPQLAAHRGDPDLPWAERTGLLFLECQAYRTLAISRGLNEESAHASAAFHHCFDLASKHAVRAVSEPVANPFEFFSIRVPAAHALVALAEAARLSETVVGCANLELIPIRRFVEQESPNNERLSANSINIDELLSISPSQDGLPSENWYRPFSAGKAARIMNEATDEHRQYSIPLYKLAEAVGMPDGIPKNLLYPSNEHRSCGL
jgi:hypothetical protein